MIKSIGKTNSWTFSRFYLLPRHNNVEKSEQKSPSSDVVGNIVGEEVEFFLFLKNYASLGRSPLDEGKKSMKLLKN